jgi:hypothetical protein
MFLALLAGCSLLLVGLLVCGMATAFIERLLGRWTRAGRTASAFWKVVQGRVI